MLDSTRRFSSRVENYVLYRPHYPQAVIGCLRENCGLTPASLIADVGSGTGILSELFLRNGNAVYGVEPNREMREAGGRLLEKYSRFKSVNGTAEASSLPPACVDFVTAGQAFHWFEPERAKAEFGRILKPAGWIVLVWNKRREIGTPFALAYEQLLRDYSTDYEQVNHKRIDEAVLGRFFENGFEVRTFENAQHFDFAGLRGRLLSSSYSPEAGHPQYEAMLTALQHIFEAHRHDGQVAFEYGTNLYYGRLNGNND